MHESAPHCPPHSLAWKVDSSFRKASVGLFLLLALASSSCEAFGGLVAGFLNALNGVSINASGSNNEPTPEQQIVRSADFSKDEKFTTEAQKKKVTERWRAVEAKGGFKEFNRYRPADKPFSVTYYLNLDEAIPLESGYTEVWRLTYQEYNDNSPPFSGVDRLLYSCEKSQVIVAAYLAFKGRKASGDPDSVTVLAEPKAYSGTQAEKYGSFKFLCPEDTPPIAVPEMEKSLEPEASVQASQPGTVSSEQ